MTEIVGHQNELIHLENEIASQNYSHAYLFVGPKNIGKTEVALRFAMGLICDNDKFEGCNKCPNCSLFEAGNHPDFYLFDGDNSFGVAEMRSAIKNLDLKPHQSKNRVLIITNIERMTKEASNAFLKTLEEPQPGNVIILTTSKDGLVLETIRSRARVIRFNPVNKKHVFEFLNQNLLLKKDISERIAKFTGGRPGLARTYSDDVEFFESLMAQAQKMLQIFKSQSIYDKISFADNLLKEKEMVLFLEFCQIYAENNLQVVIKAGREGDILGASRFLESLGVAIGLLSANVNKRLVIDNLMLGNLHD